MPPISEILQKILFCLDLPWDLTRYDKFMIGAFLTNYKLPPSRFQFFLAPMYATGSKNFTGTGLVNYSFYPDNFFKR